MVCGQLSPSEVAWLLLTQSRWAWEASSHSTAQTSTQERPEQRALLHPFLEPSNAQGHYLLPADGRAACLAQGHRLGDSRGMG